MPLPAIKEQFAAVRRDSVPALSYRIAQIARAANAAVMAIEPKPLGYLRTVDGVAGAPEEAVRPHGLIVYQYQRLDLVIEFALDALRTLSPRLSGSYSEAHTVFINGQPAQAPYVISADDNVIIANTQPYARKIEVGHMKMSVPGTDHVYAQAEQIVGERFDDLVQVKFTFVALPNGDALAGQFRRGIQPQSRRRLQRDTRRGASPMFPALTFKLK